MSDEQVVWTRRRFLAMAGAAASAAILAACGGGKTTEAPATTAAKVTAAPTSAASGATGAAGAPTTAASSAISGTSAAGAGAITLPTGDAKNPLKVKADAPLDVVIFKGGYGDDYAVYVEKIYQANFPQSKVMHAGIQRLAEQLQPRFVGGNPPDVIDNSGAGNLDTGALVAEGQLADLADLMGGPSFDTPGKTFADTLLPGAEDAGKFDGKQFVLNYVFSVTGIWSSSSLLQKNDWQYPKTWDDMLALCEKIKAKGTAPWTYQGKYPQYMNMVLHGMIYHQGGADAIRNIDNLQPNAWKQDAVKNAVNAVNELAAKDYIMSGSAGLTHIEAQAAWLQGKAVFIPCGSWLENEMKGQIPDGFNMVVNPVPSLSGDKVPFTGIQAAAGEGFIVPAKGKNVQGGKEFLRELFSKQGGRFFAQNTKSLTVVQGSADGLDLGTAFQSVKDTAATAGQNTFTTHYDTWYQKLMEAARDQMGALMTKQIKPDDFMNNVQKVADDIAKDDSIKKFKA